MNGYIASSYTPSPKTHPAIIINQKINPEIKSELIATARKRGLDFDFEHLREIYPNGYQWSDVVKHRAAVIVPYAVQIYTLTELYRANISIFCPSLDLMVKWEIEYGIFAGRKSNAEICYSHVLRDIPRNVSLLSPHSKHTTTPDPNGDSETALRWWLGLCDWLQPHMRHVVLFDSMDDLMSKIGRVDPFKLSRSMELQNAELRNTSRATWMRLLKKLWSAPSQEPVPTSYDAGAVSFPRGDFSDEAFLAGCAESLGSTFALNTNFRQWINETIVAEKGLPHAVMLRSWLEPVTEDQTLSLAQVSCALDANLSACYRSMVFQQACRECC